MCDADDVKTNNAVASVWVRERDCRMCAMLDSVMMSVRGTLSSDTRPLLLCNTGHVN